MWQEACLVQSTKPELSLLPAFESGARGDKIALFSLTTREQFTTSAILRESQIWLGNHRFVLRSDPGSVQLMAVRLIVPLPETRAGDMK